MSRGWGPRRRLVNDWQSLKSLRMATVDQVGGKVSAADFTSISGWPVLRVGDPGNGFLAEPSHELQCDRSGFTGSNRSAI